MILSISKNYIRGNKIYLIIKRLISTAKMNQEKNNSNLDTLEVKEDQERIIRGFRTANDADSSSTLKPILTPATSNNNLTSQLVQAQPTKVEIKQTPFRLRQSQPITIGSTLYTSSNIQQVAPPRQGSQLMATAIDTTSTPTASGQQYKQYTERLIGAINNHVNQAMHEASGYSIATSKSTQHLPPATSRFPNEQQTKVQQQRLRVSESVKGMLLREQARDEQLASRLKQINQKQTARIKEIESQELRNQQNELEDYVRRTGSFQELKPSQSQKTILQPIVSQVDLKLPLEKLEKSSKDTRDHDGQQPQQDNRVIKRLPQTTRESFDQNISHIVDNGEDQSAFDSNRKHYFNNSQSQQQYPLRVEDQQNSAIINHKHLRADSGSLSAFRNREDISATVNNSITGLTRGGAHNASAHTISTWGGVSTSRYPHMASKDRADVSFLNEKATMLISQNAAKKMSLEANQGLLLSQSKLTTGSEGRDDYIQLALGLRNIGKSILDMPKSLDDLRLLSREYVKNLGGAADDLQDEQVYLQYIEDHVKAQESAATGNQDTSRSMINSTLSPIRNLADFYERKLSKIQAHGHHGEQSIYKSAKGSPTKRSQRVSANQTYVNIDQMTAGDLEKLTRSPPKIAARRKNMKVVNNKAMSQFGAEAFNIKIDDGQETDEKMTRLNTQKSSNMDKTVDATNTTATGLSKVEASSIQEGIANIGGQRGKSQLKQQNSKKPKKELDRKKVSDREKLLKSLNDLADNLTKPSIANEEKEKPQWLQENLKEQAARMGLSQANLGKPSSRQDAILLAKWFKGTIDMIESEQQTSQNYFAKAVTKKTFPSQRVNESEILQTDSYLLVQIAHNIAIKEITRQVSVQCIERGILLKTVFDSYVRMIDLIFVDSVHQRKLLAHKFASVCEKQVFFQATQVRNKEAVIDMKDRKIAELNNLLDMAASREKGLRFTNKKLAAIAHRNQTEIQGYQQREQTLEKQVRYLQDRLDTLLDQLDPEKAAVIKKDTRRGLQKIHNQMEKSHAAKNGLGMRDVDPNTGETVIRTAETATDCEDFHDYLEALNGGPLTMEVEQQVSLEMEDAENSGFDLLGVGAVVEQETWIDPDWRRESRPKRMRAKSAVDKPDKRIEMFDAVSFDTSSHHTIDYLLETRSAKTYTFGQDRRYQHIKKQRPKKRALSAYNFNWNLLVARADERFDREAKENEARVSGHPMTKLTEIIGAELLAKIQNEIPELYEKLMDYVQRTKRITYAFCRDLLAQYNINLDEERKAARTKFADQYRDDNSNNNLDGSQDSNDDVNMMDVSGLADRGADAKSNAKDAQGKRDKNKKKDHMYQFVEWSFVKRTKKGKKLRIRKDHPSFSIVTKLLEQFKAGKDIKVYMPVKSAVRYIYNIYMGKASEFAQVHNALSKKVILQTLQGNDRSSQSPISPKALSKNKSNQDTKDRTGRVATSIENSALKKSATNAKQESEQPPTKERSKSPNAQDFQDKGADEATSMNLIEWTYEYFQNRYGLKNVADKKFSQFVGSILRFKDKTPRFRLFGRFLQLYDELSEQDLKLYVDIVHNKFKSVLNFQILESDEVILIPTQRAIDYFKQTFVARLTQSSMSHCLKIIRQKQIAIQKQHSEKHLHLNSYQEAVQLDDFAEFVIHTTNQLQSEKLQNIYEIFMAADLKNNGVLELVELRTLYKLLCNQHSGDVVQQMQEIRNLFNEYAQVYGNIKGSEGIKIRGISFDNFEKLCLEKDVFTIRQQNSFINAATKTFLNVTDNQDAFTQEFEKMCANLDSIYDRLTLSISENMDSQIVSDSEKERYQDMVEYMARAIMKPVNKKIAFLTFKIVEETIKRVCLKVEIEQLMAVHPDTIRSLKKALNDYEQKSNPVAAIQDKAIKTANNFSIQGQSTGAISVKREKSNNSNNANIHQSMAVGQISEQSQSMLDLQSQGASATKSNQDIRRAKSKPKTKRIFGGQDKAQTTRQPRFETNQPQ